MFAVLLAAAAIAATPLRLSDLLREAKEKNPDLIAARADARAMREEIGPAGALDDPMLMSQLWNAPTDLRSQPLMFQLTQPISLGGKRRAARAAARADADAMSADASMRERMIEQDVVMAWADLFMADRLLAIDAEIEKTAQAMVEAAATRVSAGKGMQVETLRAQGEILAVQGREADARARRASAEAELVALLDRPLGSEIPIVSEPALLPALPPVEDLAARAGESRPEVAAARAAVAKADAELSFARAQRIPDVAVTVGGMHMFGEAMGDRDSVTGGIQVGLPIFVGSKNRPRIRAAAARVDAAKAREDALRARIGREVASASALADGEAQQIRLHHQLIPLSRQALDSAVAGYAAGKTDFTMVIDAERDLQMHEIELAMHLAAYEIHLAELERAVGADLGLAAAADAGRTPEESR